MSEISKEILSLVQTGGKAADKMTTALKALGDGSMQGGIKRIADFFQKTGADEGFKAGLESGKIKGALYTTAAFATVGVTVFVGNEIRKAIKKNKENKALKAEGEAILKVIEDNIVEAENNNEDCSTDKAHSENSNLPREEN